MPFNKLKKYPELLDLSGLDERARKASLEGIFDRDIKDNDNFCFRGKRIYPIKTDGEIDMSRELLHLTTEETEDTDERGNIYKRRVYDRYRSERLHWIKPHIDEKITDSEIQIFSVHERNQHKRSNVVRTYIWNKTRKYVIVLEPQVRNGEAYYLLTAYYLNKEYGEKQMEKKFAHKLNEIL